jgi:hypothetical protein
MADKSKIEAIRRACEDAAFQAACQRYAHANGTSIAIMAAARDALEKLLAENRDAERYRWLRRRDLDAIDAGGVFAGQTPQNLVLNGEDLDRAVDAAMRLDGREHNEMMPETANG